jgi:hypothetical protein
LSQRFRLLALDIDGTLLGSDRRVSLRNRDAVRAARAAGVRLVLVTGRRLPAARRIAEQLDPDVPLVLHNGALIVEDGRVIRYRPLALDVARESIRAGRAAGADPVVHRGRNGEGQLLVAGISPSNTLLAYYLDKAHPDVTIVDDLERSLCEDPVQVMFGGGMQEVASLEGRLAQALGPRARLERTVYPARGVAILDVIDPAVSKAEAVAFLEARWGLVPITTLAIGDNWNDREMLEHAGLGLVMGNADPVMRALGLPTLPGNDEDGVAVAIERHVLTD